ncbi:UPAR/Ly6 domain-containing protein crok-like [Prorops nasuta]|uniref:UPAR/Ly6 domain-containing protein crok-like n=1 Tax=Prorops nasuta TaxID=863751 RepID=UPI0034CD9423
MVMKTGYYAIIAIFILMCFIEQSYTIKCWVCRSDSDPKCADPFDNSTVPITDCKQEPTLPHLPNVRPTMCRKIRQKVHNKWRYFRSCAYMGEPGIEGDERFCLMRTGTYNIFMEYCTCNSKDGCNAAPYRHRNLILLSIVSIFSFINTL